MSMIPCFYFYIFYFAVDVSGQLQLSVAYKPKTPGILRWIPAANRNTRMIAGVNEPEHWAFCRGVDSSSQWELLAVFANRNTGYVCRLQGGTIDVGWRLCPLWVQYVDGEMCSIMFCIITLVVLRIRFVIYRVISY